MRKWRAEAVLITRGADGMSLFRPRFPVQHFPTEPRDVFEVTGAGDTVVAVCALALAARRELRGGGGARQHRCRFVGDEVGTVAVPLQKLGAAIEDQPMKSMTGYGEGSQSVRGAKVTVQIRSLNHRHLDLQLRVPREYLSLEEEIRKTTARQNRPRAGRSYSSIDTPPKHRRANWKWTRGLVGQYIAGVKQLKKRYGLAGEVDVSLLTNIPDFVHVRDAEADAAGERQALLKAVAAALNKLERSREREGAHCAPTWNRQIRHLSNIAGDLEARVAENPLRLQRGGASETDETEYAATKSRGDCKRDLKRRHQ